MESKAVAGRNCCDGVEMGREGGKINCDTVDGAANS
jgi:hypothetical protein